MIFKNKIWAVIHPIAGVIFVKDTKKGVLETIELLKKTNPEEKYQAVELVEAPEKIKMTSDEWKEIKKCLSHYDTLYSFLEEMNEGILYDRLFSKSKKYSNEQQADFARLWASENPEELVEIEKEKKYELIFKATTRHQGLIGAGTDYAHVAYSEMNQVQYYTQSEIDAIGGDDKLTEWGVKKVEVEE